MIRFGLVVLALGMAGSEVRAQDAIRAKLKTSKTLYDTEIERAKKSVVAFLDEREKKAREEGNKRAVDLIKLERQAFEEKSELPKSLSATYRTPFAAARAKLDAAFKTAIREYTRNKMDSEAAEVEKERIGFLNGGAPGETLEERLLGKSWDSPNGLYEFRAGGGLFVDGKLTATWAILGGDRVVTMMNKDGSDHYDIYHFNKDVTQFQALYIGRIGKDTGGGFAGKLRAK